MANELNLDDLEPYLDAVFRRQPVEEGNEKFGYGYWLLQPRALLEALAHHHASIQMLNARMNAYDRLERTVLKLVLRTFDPRPNTATPMTEQIVTRVPLAMLADMSFMNTDGFFSLLTYDEKPSERGVLPLTDPSSGKFYDIVISRVDE